MAGRWYIGVYKLTKVIKKCTVYKMTATVRREKSLNISNTKLLKSNLWGSKL